MAINPYKFIFVYGTLKTGERNYHYLTTDVQPGEHAKFLAKCRLREPYPLVVTPHSKYNMQTPYLLNKPGVGKTVVGELYEVDDVIINRLDQLECHPVNYIRTQTVVVNLADDSEIKCEVYFKNDPDSLLALPHISDFAEDK